MIGVVSRINELPRRLVVDPACLHVPSGDQLNSIVSLTRCGAPVVNLLAYNGQTGLAARPRQCVASSECASLAEHLDQALLLLDECVDTGGLAVEVVGNGALLPQLGGRTGIGISNGTERRTIEPFSA